MPVRKCVLLVGVLLGLLSGLPAHGQGSGDNWTLPDLQPITPENVGDIAYIGALGYGSSPRPLWSPDGQTVVIGTSSGLWIYHLSDPSNPILQPDLGQILGFTADGTAFFARDIWGGTSLVDLLTLQRTYPVAPPTQHFPPEPPPKGQLTLTSPDGRYQATEIPSLASDPEVIRFEDAVWQIVDTSTHTLVAEIQASSRFAPYTFWMEPFVPRFNASGFLFRRDNNLWRWNPSDGTEQLLIENINDAAFSPDNRYVTLYRINMDMRRDAPLGIWDINGPQAVPLMQITAADSDYWNSLAVHPNGQEIALGGSVQHVRRWNLADRGLTFTDYYPSSPDSDMFAAAVAYSADGHWLGNCLVNYYNGDEPCSFRETTSGIERAIIHGGFLPQAMVFHPSQALVAIGFGDGSIRLWNMTTLLAGGMDNEVTQSDYLLADHHGRITDLAFSPDGRYLVSSSEDNSVRVWDWASSTVTQVYHDYNKSVTAMAVSPDSQWIASGSDDGTVKLWNFTAPPDAPRPDPLITFPTTEGAYQSPGALVIDVTFSPDGRLVAASQTLDGVYIWDTQTRAQVAHIPRFEWAGGVLSGAHIGFNPHGTLLIVAVQWGGAVELWGVPQ